MSVKTKRPSSMLCSYGSSVGKTLESTRLAMGVEKVATPTSAIPSTVAPLIGKRSSRVRSPTEKRVAGNEEA